MKMRILIEKKSYLYKVILLNIFFCYKKLEKGLFLDNLYIF